MCSLTGSNVGISAQTLLALWWPYGGPMLTQCGPHTDPMLAPQVCCYDVFADGVQRWHVHVDITGR